MTQGLNNYIKSALLFAAILIGVLITSLNVSAKETNPADWGTTKTPDTKVGDTDWGTTKTPDTKIGNTDWGTTVTPDTKVGNTDWGTDGKVIAVADKNDAIPTDNKVDGKVDGTKNANDNGNVNQNDNNNNININNVNNNKQKQDLKLKISLKESDIERIVDHRISVQRLPRTGSSTAGLVGIGLTSLAGAAWGVKRYFWALA